MDEPRKFAVDFPALRSGLGAGEFASSELVAGGLGQAVNAREHGYRRIDAHTLLHLMNFEVREPYRLSLARADLVCIQAIITGSYHRWIGPRMDPVSSHMLQISNTPTSASAAQAGVRLRGMLLICDRRHLLDHYRLNPEHVPAAFRPIFLSREGTPDVFQLPLTTTGIGLVDQMLACRYPEPLRGIFLGVKTVEFLCHVVAQLQQPLRSATPRLIGENARRKAIDTAADIYRREIEKPPSIEQLALRVGLNRNELSGGFREAFGLTPHAFAQARRMERARDLLREGRLSISEIGRRVGYEGYSSFARAYHAHFGHAPALGRSLPVEG
ncbi:AraC family transcriptional regulator [Ancylobacter sp. A5.8]|uniref:helix-turn-helix domain-containing protein n=1 Tax=Ancylobacter gelatini TaxID=2919920 RepID=UPI001F4D40E7|nr:AraC family transcriptional regulator [Ancylobacter gelatini]MCJ8142035.1 AraC family transcriptional regulator [Ancylobacter gelatini]